MTAWGKPEGVPPSPKNKGEIITRFEAWIDGFSVANAKYKMTVLVPMDELYKAQLAVDRPQETFLFEVYGRKDIDIEDLDDELLRAMGLKEQ